MLNSILLGIFVWSGLGLLGTAIMLIKNAAIPGRAIIMSLLTIPHAIVFGPIWMLIALLGRTQKECPYCKSIIPSAATVCSKCTRSLAESKDT